jgi:hypothetical protein
MILEIRRLSTTSGSFGWKAAAAREAAAEHLTGIFSMSFDQLEPFFRYGFFPAAHEGETTSRRKAEDWRQTETREVRMGNPSQNSIDYYREREQQEISLADTASSPAIKKIHLEMADCYRKMAQQLDSAWGPLSEISHSAAAPSPNVQ